VLAVVKYVMVLIRARGVKVSVATLALALLVLERPISALVVLS
jgi:hypothetical protein